MDSRRGGPPHRKLAEVTIADVAREARVSVPTVSRILNNRPYVADETRAKVLAAIESLGFVPHAQAQRLRAGRTQTIALLYPLETTGKRQINQLEMDFMIGAAESAGLNNFFFNLITTPVTEHGILSYYRSAQVDGLVIMQVYRHDWRVELLRSCGYPFVMIGRCADNTGLSFIDLDVEACVLTAFEHLVSLGHTRIGFLTASHSLLEEGYSPAVFAMAGYQQAVEKYRLPRLYREVSFDVKEIHAGVLSLLNENPDVTGIVSTTHDVWSAGALGAVAASGRHVPEDLSWITIIPERLTELTRPPLTAIDFPSFAMGQRAATMLINMLTGRKAEPEQILVTPRLVIRSSTGPLGD